MKIFNIPLHITLGPEAEREFRETSALHFVSFVRVGAVLGFLTSPLWLIWDQSMGTYESFMTALDMRMTMMGIFAAVFGVTFLPWAVRYIYQIASATLLATVLTAYLALELVPGGMVMGSGIGALPLIFVTAMTSFPVAATTVALSLAIVDVFLYSGHVPQAFFFTSGFTHGTLALLSLGLTYVAIQYRRYAFLMEMDLARSRTEAEAATRAKSELLTTLEHEVRTSVTGSLGFIAQLRDMDLDKTQRDYAETVRYSGETLLTVLGDILDSSKAGAETIQIEPVDFSIERLLAGVVALTRSRADEKGLTLTANIDKNVPIHLRGDITRLRQVLLNLVGNAIKFTPRGRVAITVNDAGGAGRHHLIRFQVEDTGAGLSDEQRKKLFSDGAAVSRQYDGTGPGLVVCRRIVELMDGTIGARSTAATGSTFWFEVPLAPASQSG